MGCAVDEVEFNGAEVVNLKTGGSISRKDIGNKVMCFNNEPLCASGAYSSPTSPAAVYGRHCRGGDRQRDGASWRWWITRR